MRPIDELSAASPTTFVLAQAAERASVSDREVFLNEAIAGLTASPKTIPCKYFYDERGSQLFDAICRLPEYYPTRTELQIMEDNAEAITGAIKPRSVLVELGSGSSIKTRILLERLNSLAAYVPVDISGEHLERTAAGLRNAFPGLTVRPVAADYTKPFGVPVEAGSEVTVYFPGSTIGNFHPEEATAFMRQIRALCGNGGALLIGVDLRKDPDVLYAAYNDAAGVTADFNLNVLTRMNRELEADFDLDGYTHEAIYNEALGRIEMHLGSRWRQNVRLGDSIIEFAAGETIWTECSYKHTLEGFARLAGEAGFAVEQVWTDPKNWFSVQMLRSAT